MKFRFTFHAAVLIFLMFLSGCSREPKPIVYGKDACDFCRMTIVDKRFGGEIMSTTGKPYKFDDAICIVAFIENSYLPKEKVEATYLTDYTSGQLLKVGPETPVIHSELFKSPMGSNIAVISDARRTEQTIKETKGTSLTWEQATFQLTNKEALNGR